MPHLVDEQLLLVGMNSWCADNQGQEASHQGPFLPSSTETEGAGPCDGAPANPSAVERAKTTGSKPEIPLRLVAIVAVDWLTWMT